jgi:hypothetical protein
MSTEVGKSAVLFRGEGAIEVSMARGRDDMKPSSVPNSRVRRCEALQYLTYSGPESEELSTAT